MTLPNYPYTGSKIVSILNEYANPKVEDQELYRVIYAREAPVIITGKAAAKFFPTNMNVQITIAGDYWPSCPGATSLPIPTLMATATNPMGYGANIDDLVTLQRTYSPGGANANYKYIVIGTGAIPDSSVRS